MSIRQKRNVKYALTASLSFKVKEGGESMTDAKKRELFSVLGNSIANFGGEMRKIALEGREVGLTLTYEPKHSISSIVNVLKARSSRMVGIKWEREYTVESKGGENE